MGRPSRPKFGLRGHWKSGGSVGGGTVATAVAVAPGIATAVLVAPWAVADEPAEKLSILK